MSVPTVADAIDLATRAAYFHRVWLGQPIPEPGLPKYLWARREPYYGKQALSLSITLRDQAAEALQLAILGTDEAYGAEVEALTPAEILIRGDELRRDRRDEGIEAAGAEVARLRLSPDDVIVVGTNDAVSHQVAGRISDSVKAVLPGHPVLILSGGLSLQVLTPDGPL